MVASNYEKELPGNAVDAGLPGLKGTKLLRGAALYGANASGKTNLFRALQFVANFVKNSATRLQPNESIGVSPFKLDAKSPKEPSVFEVHFVAAGCRYLFELAVDDRQVVREALTAYPKGKAQLWYDRTKKTDGDEYTWKQPAEAFKRDKSLEEKTRPNALFLSVAAQFNHPQLKEPFTWFQDQLVFIYQGGLDGQATVQALENVRLEQKVLDLLAHADIGVVGAGVSREELREVLPGMDEMVSAFNVPMMYVKSDKLMAIKVRLLHRGENGESFSLDLLEEESAGTTRFFSLLGPWLDLLESNKVLLIDELESSLHPLLARELVKLVMLHAEPGTVCPQLLFTTHSPVLLDNSLIRRDQIWMTEKDDVGVSHLYPLTDYKPRKGESLAKGYLAGRYGAIPDVAAGLLP